MKYLEKLILLLSFLGENVRQSLMYLLEYHKIMNG